MKDCKKYDYFLVIQGNYGGCCGWEDLSWYDKTVEGQEECNGDYQSYRDNERQYSHRIVMKRLLKD